MSESCAQQLVTTQSRFLRMSTFTHFMLLLAIKTGQTNNHCYAKSITSISHSGIKGLRQTLSQQLFIASSSSVFCPRAGPSLETQAPRLQFCPKAGLPIANLGTYVVVLLEMNRCGSFSLLSAAHSLFSI